MEDIRKTSQIERWSISLMVAANCGLVVAVIAVIFDHVHQWWIITEHNEYGLIGVLCFFSNDNRFESNCLSKRIFALRVGINPSPFLSTESTSRQKTNRSRWRFFFIYSVEEVRRAKEF